MFCCGGFSEICSCVCMEMVWIELRNMVFFVIIKFNNLVCMLCRVLLIVIGSDYLLVKVNEVL